MIMTFNDDNDAAIVDEDERKIQTFISQSTHPMWGHMSIFQIVYSNERKKWMRNEIVRIVRASA